MVFASAKTYCKGGMKMNRLKRFSIIPGVLALGLSAPLVSAAGESQDALKAQAKITEKDARATALAKVPGGTVQTAELEREHGKLVWSFDINDPKSPNVIEVQVDAKTGDVVSKKVESPADQAKEVNADKMKPQPH
jgi:hypothetical protein